ncbi:hypothetical protein KKA85_05440 [bacterium]|nr:hypothetical protein [bacterium]MBU1675206.1 hypothetical protein [bacterium]
MNDSDRLATGSGALTWDIMSGEQAPLVWTIDPSDGVIQGPLDLCFLNGKLLHLVLKPGQVALLTAREGRRAFFRDGGYLLRIGAGGLPADGLLYFMHTDRTFGISWEQIIPVPRNELCEPTTRLASGSFDVRIESPVRFHAEMLGNRAGEGEDICRDILAKVMPTMLTIRLAHACGREATTAKQREVLAALRPDDLNPDLAPYGLSCTDMRIDERFLNPQQPVPVARSV